MTTFINAPVIPMGNGLELPQVIYKGQAVLTAKAVAKALGTDPDNVQQSYYRNRTRFQDGKHVHVIDAREAKALGFLHVSSKLNPQIEGLDYFRYAGKGMTFFTREAKAMGFPHSARKIELEIPSLNFFRYSGAGMVLFTREARELGFIHTATKVATPLDGSTLSSSVLG